MLSDEKITANKETRRYAGDDRETDSKRLKKSSLAAVVVPTRMAYEYRQRRNAVIVSIGIVTAGIESLEAIHDCIREIRIDAEISLITEACADGHNSVCFTR